MSKNIGDRLNVASRNTFWRAADGTKTEYLGYDATDPVLPFQMRRKCPIKQTLQTYWIRRDGIPGSRDAALYSIVAAWDDPIEPEHVTVEIPQIVPLTEQISLPDLPIDAPLGKTSARTLSIDFLINQLQQIKLESAVEAIRQRDEIIRELMEKIRC